MKDQLTVEELIAELQKWPPKALVWHEGCDCNGKANGVTAYGVDGEIVEAVYITRSN